MKKLLVSLSVIFPLWINAQVAQETRTFGATLTDSTTLAKMDIAVPVSGPVSGAIGAIPFFIK